MGYLLMFHGRESNFIGGYHFDPTFAYVISLARNSSIPFLRQIGKSVLLFVITKWRLITLILSYANCSLNDAADFFSQMSVVFENTPAI